MVGEGVTCQNCSKANVCCHYNNMGKATSALALLLHLNHDIPEQKKTEIITHVNAILDSWFAFACIWFDGVDNK